MLPSASSMTTTSPQAASKPARRAAPLPGVRSWTMRASGREVRAAKIVSSVERPSTMIPSSTIRGRRSSTQPMLRSSLSVGMTALTAGGSRRSKRPIRGPAPTSIGRPPWLRGKGLRAPRLSSIYPTPTLPRGRNDSTGGGEWGRLCPRRPGYDKWPGFPIGVQFLQMTLTRGEDGGLGAVARSKLDHDPGEVVLHRARRDVELVGDRLVAAACRGEAQDLQLAGGQRGALAGGGRGRERSAGLAPHAGEVAAHGHGRQAQRGGDLGGGGAVAQALEDLALAGGQVLALLGRRGRLHPARAAGEAGERRAGNDR